MSQVYNVPLLCTFEAMTCCKCGISFAVDGQVRRRWQEKGESFYCPNGHSQHYTETDIQRLKKQLERSEREKTWAQENAKAERAAREKTERRLTATRGAKTRMANRIKHGVCPCCNRTFQNVLQHMATKHPDFSPSASHG